MQNSRRRMTASDAQDFFDFQPCSSASLPNPAPLLENLAMSVIEILLGVRDVQQIARWVTAPTYASLVRRALDARRARDSRARGELPAFTIGTVRAQHCADGVVEGTVIVRSSGRSRAVAIRLEGLDGRWRATSLAVL